MTAKPNKLDLLERVEMTGRTEWRAWLKKHHTRTEGIWLVRYKQHIQDKYLAWGDIVDEALCFGWIDGVARALDDDRSMLYLSPRRPKSVWSKVNKERIARLITTKRMAPAGSRKIEVAKQNGSWTELDAIEAMETHPELDAALDRNKAARRHYDSFPPGARKQIIRWVSEARTAPTRVKRIQETVALAAKGIRARQPVPKAQRGSANRAERPSAKRNR
jgi:uncharacterized protein YdeI (YjbR/CyaY-like superfamily)